MLVLVVCLLAAWLGPKVWDAVSGDREVGADAPLDDQCGDVPDSASRLTLTGQDSRALGAASVGKQDATTAVVLRHGASQTLCDWLGWADDVAEETGARVVLFDRRGQGSSPGDDDLTPEPGDVAAAVALAREDGASQVVLVASSMGNDSTWNALPRIDGEVCAVVSVSPVVATGDVDALEPGVLPRAVWTTYEDENASIVATAERLLAVAKDAGAAHRGLAVATDDHSLALVRNHDAAEEFVTEAIASCR